MTPEEFRAALKEHGIRQVTFAGATGMAPTTVSRWAKGVQPVPGWVGLVMTLMRENAINRARLDAFGIQPAAPRAIRLQGEDIPAGQC